MVDTRKIEPVSWSNDRLVLMDQRLLPGKEEYLQLETVAEAARAITDLVVRGAPAIGVTAAYGAVLAARARLDENSDDWKSLLLQDLDMLAAARPTAVNLAWAVDRMRLCIEATQPSELLGSMFELACLIHRQDIEANYLMGDLSSHASFNTYHQDLCCGKKWQLLF